MSRDKDDKSNEQKHNVRRGNAPTQGPAQGAAQGPGVPPITSAPQQGQSASAFVQPAQTVPDGDPRFAIKDAGTPYVVGLGHVSTNPTQYRNDQEQAAKDKEEENKDQDQDAEKQNDQNQDDADTDEQSRNR
jgi:hypothetical protein